MPTITPLGRRAAVFLAAGACLASLGAAVAPAASAAPVLGTLSITPTTGTESTGLNASLSAPCPVDSTGIVGYLTGPGIAAESSVLQSNRSPVQSFQISSIFKDVFAANSVAQPNGTYTVRMACIGSDAFTENGEFSQQVVFTPRAGTNNATYVTQVPPTTTVLATPTPADPVVSGSSVTLQATVDGGSSGTPTGSVQFRSGSSNVGAAVALVSGVASVTTTALPAGTGSLTAVYVPGGGNPLAASTSAPVSYVVAGPTSITGTPRVGRTLTCAATTGGTKSYTWTKNGVLTGITTASVSAPASWLNATVSCALTSTKGATSVTRASAPVKVLIGSAPVATTKPSVRGIAKVGKVLTCAHGTWSPTPSTYKYQWLRSGRAITGKTASTYKAVAADRGKLISCKVTAVKPGYTNGTATAPARKVT